MKKPAELIKTLKKLKVKAGDIIVVTLNGTPYRYDVDNVRDEFAAMPFMAGVELIITTPMVKIKKGKLHGGKHQVFLDNLEYLEYLAKHKGE